MSVTHQKPTGVFIRLPLSDDDIRKMDLAMSERMMAHSKPTLESVSEAGMLAIGAKVDSSVPVVGYIPEKPCLTKRDGTNASTFEDREDRRHTIPLVRQSDAQAQIAALEAEVVRLRGVLCEIAESDDTDNALDPECNKRVAREALKGGAA